MCFSRSFSLLFLMALPVLAGCTPGPAPDTKANGDEPQAEVPKDSWVYHSKEYGFSLRFPSPAWKKSLKKDPQHVVDFYRFYLGSPSLACVRSVKKQSLEQFHASVKNFREYIARNSDHLTEPTWTEGEKPSGDVYVYVATCEKGNSEANYFYVASSYTWLKERGLTVMMLFEGQGKKRSKIFRADEARQFEKEARDICLSVE
jgi:hypothetical protein